MRKEEVVSKFVAMPEGKRLAWLSLLAHNLTVCARAYYTDTPVDIRLERSQALNEVLHIVTAQLMHVASNDANQYPDDVLINILFEVACDAGRHDLMQSIDWSFAAI